MVRQLPLFALVLVVVLVWLGHHLRGILVRADLEIARQSSLLTVSAVEARMESERTHASWARALENVTLAEHTRVEVLDADGTVLFATDPALIGVRYELTDPSCAACHRDAAGPPTSETALVRGPGDEPFQVFAAPLRNRGECRRCHGEADRKLGMVYVHQSVEPVDRQVRSILLALLLAGLVALLLTVVSTRVLLGRYLGRPLRTLAAGAERIGAGDLEPRIELPERTELTLLAETLNNSAARLGATMTNLERQRDDFQALYALVDQLSRAVLPAERTRRCVELAAEILKKDCALVRPGAPGDAEPTRESITFAGPDGAVTERPIVEAGRAGDLPPYFPEALVERWREEYNTIRPHSSLGYRPPAPEAIAWPSGFELMDAFLERLEFIKPAPSQKTTAVHKTLVPGE